MARSNRYPTRNGVPVHPNELDLPETSLNIHRKHNLNNHHLWFTARALGRLLITDTLRSLERNQVIMPKDTHVALHSQFEAPEPPDLSVSMNILEEAFMAGELLKYGSANNPRYEEFTANRWALLQAEYNLTNRIAA